MRCVLVCNEVSCKASEERSLGGTSPMGHRWLSTRHTSGKPRQGAKSHTSASELCFRACEVHAAKPFERRDAFGSRKGQREANV